jgi:hypothetical protein
MDQGMTVFTYEDVRIDLLLCQMKHLVPKRNIFLFRVRMVKIEDYLVHSGKDNPALFTCSVFVGYDLGYSPARDPAPGDIGFLPVPLDLLPLLQPVKPVILIRAATPGIRGEMCHRYPWEMVENNGCGILAQNDSSAQSLYNQTN